MIETKRTFLRALEKRDLELKHKWMNNPIVRETLLLSVPISLYQLELWYESIIKDVSREDFIIVYKQNNEAIGFAGYCNIDWKNRKAEPFITIGVEELEQRLLINC